MWDYQNSEQSELSKEIIRTGFADTMPKIALYRSLSGNFYYRSITDKYWVVTTGYNTLDDGLFFFLTPTYPCINY